MGCVASRIDKEERVRVCKERKKLMKQLVRFRGEFAEAQLAYLRSLRNTGSTLRQFTESEIFTTSPLPPSPPPPPLSPDSRKLDDSHRIEVGQEEYIEHTEDEHHKHDETVESLKIKREETKMEFKEDEQEEETVANVVNSPPKNLQLAEAIVEDVSVKKWHTKDTADVPMVLWRSKKTLDGISKVLDDYFLKSSDGLKEIAVLMDIKGRDMFLPLSTSESKRERSNSTKVFSAFPWSWSSRSLQLPKDADESSGPNEPCRPGAHCITLKKLYDHEKKLYKEVKEEEYTFEHDRKSKLLQKQEDGNNDRTKTEKIRFSVESLESEILRLQDSISTTCSSIVKLIDNELYPQLVTLTSGLLHLWRTMYECHRVQHDVSQQLNILTDIQKLNLSSNYHRQAAVQLETEVSCWYDSFCKVIKSQKEYVRTLSRWIQLTDSLVDDDRKSLYSSSVHRICEQWNLAFERLQDKEAAEAIKSLLAAIHSIVMQQEEEHNLQKKYKKLDKRLQKELDSLVEMEERSAAEDEYSSLGPKHPLSLKRAKTEALKKQVDSEKAKYLNSVQVSKAMTLENLKTSLPNVFQALMTSSSLYVEAIESFDSTSEIALPSTS
ncbi:hypothetical protein D8674_040052 [Pyrus ussuriensis x Pyrus communis]|uniref:DUF632 domain-containing protein n=1 Tax=Pyrus ussuriensis x Pyrus communis TaxID=2448454 RepID=A0A5N5HLG1_9ROSA|nr:hypothetical protein D8674_040052 [Pyrus ussuriensis x Pyrus communis]